MSDDNNEPKLTNEHIILVNPKLNNGLCPTYSPNIERCCWANSTIHHTVETYHHLTSTPVINDLLGQSVGIENIRVKASSFGKQRANQDAPNPYWREGQSKVSGVAEHMLKHQVYERQLYYGKNEAVAIHYNGNRVKITLFRNKKRLTGFTVKGMESIDVLQNQSKHSAGQAWYLFDGDENRTYGVDNCPAFRCAQKFNSFQPKTQGYAQFEKALKQWLRDVRIASKL